MIDKRSLLKKTIQMHDLFKIRVQLGQTRFRLVPSFGIEIDRFASEEQCVTRTFARLAGGDKFTVPICEVRQARCAFRAPVALKTNTRAIPLILLCGEGRQLGLVLKPTVTASFPSQTTKR